MKVRPLLYLTSVVSAILGATVVYLVLSVPNDLRADALMKTAREEITNGHHDKARESLAKVVQQYPRTDAAAEPGLALKNSSFMREFLENQPDEIDHARHKCQLDCQSE